MSLQKVEPPPSKQHILTVSVEEYFHAGSFQRAVQQKHWTRFESRLGNSLEQVLNLMRRFNQTATFFVLGCVADAHPDLVARILADGHEVASSSYWPRSLGDMLPEEFREDLARTSEALHKAGARRVRGFRASRGWLRREDLWALGVLAEEGYAYDSSMNPVLRRFPGEPRRHRIHTHRTDSGLVIEEFPVSTIGVLGIRVAISGGNWARQFPHTLLSRVVASCSRRREEPLVFYFMPWEMDRGQPHLAGLSPLMQVRHYRNLAKTRWVFEDHFRKYRFQSIAEHLGLTRDVPSGTESAREGRTVCAAPTAPAPPAGEPVTLVVPLFNEEQNVGYLHGTLTDFRQRLSGRYRVHLVLVDDASRDGTWTELNAKFGSMPDCQLMHQPSNKGVAAAILAGIQRAPTEIVCSIDCDCSYDPYCLAEMIPLIREADLVTASPYHPNGHALNVPWWRLFLSKTLSYSYSLLLRDRLCTFTSCCRVYRKSVVSGLQLRQGGFLGVAETLIRLKLDGARIVEHPATLESRLLGESKMKILRAIWGHLGLLCELAILRAKGPKAPSVVLPQR